MTSKFLKRIEDCIQPSGVWSSLEINSDIMYLDFSNVELGNPKLGDKLILSIRFANSSFITLFYDDIWDIDFIANFKYETNQFYNSFSFDIKLIKFTDFELLDSIFNRYSNFKTFSLDKTSDVCNIRTDYFLIFESDKIAIVVGGNEMNFFNDDEKIDLNVLMNLSNQWMLYCLNYHLKRNIIKDSMCDKYVFK